MTDSRPAVSVIIPAHNQARYLADAIASVRKQRWRDHEIIVVDDGSTDETPTILATLGDELRVIRQANRGLAGARNTGIRAARGRYCAFLDADDTWHPGFLERSLAELEGRADLIGVYSGWRHVDVEGRPLPAASRRVVEPERLHDVLVGGNFLNACALVLRREAMLECGLFDESLRACEDWDLWLRLSKIGRIAGIPEVLVDYRLHGAAMTARPPRVQDEALRVVQKHFGPAPSSWTLTDTATRRAYGGVYRFYALSYLGVGVEEKAAAYLDRALMADPGLTERSDLYYELALGSQPRGERGQLEGLPLVDNAERIDRLLLHLDTGVRGAIGRQRFAARCALALATVGYGAGDQAFARRQLLRSLRDDPQLLMRRATLKLLLRVFLPEAVVRFARQMRRAKSDPR